MRSGRPRKILSMWPITTPLAADYPHLEFGHIPLPSQSLADSLKFGWRAFTSGTRYDWLFAGGTRPALVICLLNRLFFWRPIRIYVGVSFFLEAPAPGSLRRLVQHVKARLFRRCFRFVTVLSTEELTSYAEVWGVPRERMGLVRFKIIAQDVLDSLPRQDDGTIVTGGNSERDYATLFRAVAGLPYRVKVLSTLDLSHLSMPDNVEILHNDHSIEAFYGPMAQAALVVMPFNKGLIRSVGQGSYLSAMYLAKCVVLSDVAGVRDLVQPDTTALLAAPGDADDLRRCLVTAMEDPQLRRRIGDAAHAHVSAHNTHEAYMRYHFDTLTQLVEREDRP